jgi:uncharacterized tellurite resistance protein B-like protein
MGMSLLSWLGLAPDDGGGRAPDGITEVARPLAALGADRARFLALLAFQLARVADVDRHVSDAELARIAAELAGWGGLPLDQATLVARLARARHAAEGETLGFLAARELRDLASRDDKLALLHCLFAVAAAEDAISSAEEEAVRQVARELELSNEDYLDVRRAWSEQRAVIRDAPWRGGPARGRGS